MPLKVKVHRLPEFTSLKATGEATFEDFVQLIDRLAEETRQRGDKRLLVDLLDVGGELKFTEHFQIGERAAVRLTHLEKVASVVPETKLTRTSEKVALTRGFQLRVFSSMTEAIRWLSQAPGPKAMHEPTLPASTLRRNPVR